MAAVGAGQLYKLGFQQLDEVEGRVQNASAMAVQIFIRVRIQQNCLSRLLYAEGSQGPSHHQFEGDRSLLWILDRLPLPLLIKHALVPEVLPPDIPGPEDEVATVDPLEL